MRRSAILCLELESLSRLQARPHISFAGVSMQHHAAVVPVTIVVCNQNRVRVKKSLDDLKFGKGPLQAGMVGLVTSV